MNWILVRDAVFIITPVILVVLVICLAFGPDQYNVYFEDPVLVDDAEANTSQRGNKTSKKQVRVTTSVKIVVLGDIGRSPRMQYHAISLAKHKARVHLIGLRETDIHPSLINNPFVTVHSLSPSPELLNSRIETLNIAGLSKSLEHVLLQQINLALFVLLAPLKVIFQTTNLWLILAYRTPATKWTLVQNPPAIPVLLITSLVCFLRNSQFIIDWHNLGWSILALKIPRRNPIISIAYAYESFFARCANLHFAVTAAMSTSLARDFRISAPLVMHDRPASTFQPLSSAERASFLHALPQTTSHASAILSKRTRLLVSSTSWTADEDFSLLLDALVAYSRQSNLPPLLAIITGKGPQQAAYVARIAALQAAGQLARVTVETAFLSHADYARLLGAADLGVSLHKSSSGLDLPMKVVDMFGAGLPVVGWSGFEAWGELVEEGVNGRGFTDAKGLEKLLVELMAEDGGSLETLKAGALKEGERRWDQEWDGVVGPALGLTKASSVK